MGDVLEKVQLSSPWVTFYKQVEMLFKKDPNVKVEYDDSKKTIRLYVNGSSKAEAIEMLLPREKVFGNVSVKIKVIPTNSIQDTSSLIMQAFDGNPILKKIVPRELFGRLVTYVVFDKEVVQFFDDDLSDVNGVQSTLYQHIAREVFGDEDGLFYCTYSDDIADDDEDE